MEIRPATLDDATAIAEVHVRSWQETYVGQVPQAYLDALSVADRTASWRDQLAGAPPPDILVAIEDDRLVGFVVVGRSRDDDADDTTGEVLAIYTRGKVWGRGVGRALMEQGLGVLADRGFENATVWVLDTNERARRFYEKGGWALESETRISEIGGQEVTELRYRRPLAPTM